MTTLMNRNDADCASATRTSAVAFRVMRSGLYRNDEVTGSAYGACDDVPISTHSQRTSAQKFRNRINRSKLVHRFPLNLLSFLQTARGQQNADFHGVAQAPAYRKGLTSRLIYL
jgi:hypothetical protein